MLSGLTKLQKYKIENALCKNSRIVSIHKERVENNKLSVARIKNDKKYYESIRIVYELDGKMMQTRISGHPGSKLIKDR